MEHSKVYLLFQDLYNTCDLTDKRLFRVLYSREKN